ncbi:MAG TPA: hypothetical protein VLY87_05335, partial [Flavobacterium sp.]|nr:hypothetical protein [Flavobacterium sp.]
MRKNILIPAIIFGTLTLTSCVSKKQYASLQTEYSKLQNDYKGLGAKFHQSEIDLSSCNARVKSLEDMLAQERSSNNALKKTLESLQGSLDKSIT